MRKRTPRIAQDELSQPDPTPDTPVFVLSDFDNYVAFHRESDSFTHKDDKHSEIILFAKPRPCCG